jgi:hypothetical protein
VRRWAAFALECCFAAPSSLITQTADAALPTAYQPAFRAIARACERLLPLRLGRIQLYLMYIAAAFLLVFAAEARFARSPAEDQPNRRPRPL